METVRQTCTNEAPSWKEPSRPWWKEFLEELWELRAALLALLILAMLVSLGIDWITYQEARQDPAAHWVQAVWPGQPTPRECMIDIRTTLTPVGTIGGQPYLRYTPTTRWRTSAQCPTGTLVPMSLEQLEAARTQLKDLETLLQTTTP